MSFTEPHPGHSHCPQLGHCPNAPCALPVSLSLLHWPSAHDSFAVQRANGGRPMLARSALTWATHAGRAVAYGSPPVLASGAVAPSFASTALAASLASSALPASLASTPLPASTGGGEDRSESFHAC